MLSIINRTKKPAGDTLVEVMISIAVIALAIAISYAISGKNLNVGINARERTSAVGLAQGQIERMKEANQINASSLSSLKDPAKHFCFDVFPGHLTNNAPVLNGVIDPANNDLSTDAAHYTNTASNSCVSGGKFYLDINYVPRNPPSGGGATASGDSFAFTAKWYRVGGGVDQIVTIYYRPW